MGSITQYYWDDLVLLFAERNISPWQRANPPNVSLKNPLRWQICIVSSVDKTKLTKLLIYKQLILKSVWRRGKYTAHLQSLPNCKKNEQLLTLSKLLSWKTDAREYHQRASQQRNVSTFISSCFIQGCPNTCRCTIAVGIMDAATCIECRGKHLQSVPRHLPFSTAKL